MSDRPTEKISKSRESINEKLWRGEVTVEELRDLLGKVPQDGLVRIYSNKLQIRSPVDRKIYTLDRVK